VARPGSVARRRGGVAGLGVRGTPRVAWHGRDPWHSPSCVGTPRGPWHSLSCVARPELPGPALGLGTPATPGAGASGPHGPPLALGASVVARQRRSLRPAKETRLARRLRTRYGSNRGFLASDAMPIAGRRPLVHRVQGTHARQSGALDGPIARDRHRLRVPGPVALLEQDQRTRSGVGAGSKGGHRHGRRDDERGCERCRMDPHEIAVVA
jgi:hypothetical protein